MFPFFWDSTMLLIIPPLILSIWAQARVHRAFAKYSKIYAKSGFTGAQIAQKIMDQHGVLNIAIERIEGNLSDHFDPVKKVVRLSKGVHDSNSLAALGIAAHEVGHVLQYDQGYKAIKVREFILPVVKFGSVAAFPLFLLGFLMSIPMLIQVGLYLFGGIAVFYFITLPVEYNASRRAIEALEGGGYLEYEEIDGAKKVLSAAALTYLAAALMALMQFARFFLLSRRSN